MAVTRHSTFDKTVNTIVERNNIVNKVDGMTVIVLDAIADIEAGAGKALYRWDANDSTWILINKANTDSISFETEEKTIVDGSVQMLNYPIDNKLWGIKVIQNNNVIIADLKIEDLTIEGVNIHLNTGIYNGNKLRFTYAYGTIAQQISSAISGAVTEKFTELAEFNPTEIINEINRFETNVGLDQNGNFVPSETANYIKDTTSIMAAIMKLDEVLKTIQDSSSSGRFVGGVLENDSVITSDYTVSDGKNAIMIGPISFADNVSITVPNSSTLRII